MNDILDFFIGSKLVTVFNSPQSLVSWVSVLDLDLGSAHHYRVLGESTATTGTELGGDAASMAAWLLLAQLCGWISQLIFEVVTSTT